MPEIKQEILSVAAPVAIKPGYKTTEFWLTVGASLVGLALASGVFAPESGIDKVLGVIATALASMGYAVSRGLAKQ